MVVDRETELALGKIRIAQLDVETRVIEPVRDRAIAFLDGRVEIAEALVAPTPVCAVGREAP